MKRKKIIKFMKRKKDIKINGNQSVKYPVTPYELSTHIAGKRNIRLVTQTVR